MRRNKGEDNDDMLSFVSGTSTPALSWFTGLPISLLASVLQGWQGQSTSMWLQARGILSLTGNSKFKVWQFLKWMKVVKTSLFNYREGVPHPVPEDSEEKRAPGVLSQTISGFFEEVQTNWRFVSILKKRWTSKTNFIYKFCRKHNFNF